LIGSNRLLALIPARGDSKRLPGKNIADLAGTPLIAWTIEAALASEYIDRVIVSTDDDEIAATSEQHGADVPFMRSAALSSDDSKSIDAVIDALRKLEADGDEYDYVILLQPTSPLRATEDIDGAIEQLDDNQDDAVISVCEVDHPPQWSNTLPADKSMVGFLNSDSLNKRSQDFSTYYRLNGAIYIIRTDKVLDQPSPSFFLERNISAYVMERSASVDIDSEIDLEYAQFLIEKQTV